MTMFEIIRSTHSFCYQAVMKKCTENQTRNMIKEAATSTDVRKKKLMDILHKIDPNRSPTVQQFGLQLDRKFAQIPARILAPPVLEYGDKKTVMPRDGVWRAENIPFIKSMQATNWGVLRLDERTQQSTVKELCGMVSHTFLTSPLMNLICFEFEIFYKYLLVFSS